MLIVLIILGIFIIVGGVISYNDWDYDVTSAVLGGLLSCVVGAIPALIIGGMISILALGMAPLECKYTQDLIAMKDSAVVSGSFFLGTGRVDSDMCYIYLAETDKGITPKTIKQATNNVYIMYTDEQPHVEYWDKISDPWRLREESPYYVFYLPEDSVINTFEIDLE